MNKGQTRGIIAISIAFVIATIGGIGLSFLAVDLSIGQVLTSAFVIFVVIVPFFGYGIYTYARHTQEKSALTNDEMEKPRQLLDLLRQQGQADVDTLAQDLDTTPAVIRGYVDDLVQLALFNGIADWDNGVIAMANPMVMAAIDQCKNCENTLNIQTGTTVCVQCGTEYYKSEP